MAATTSIAVAATPLVQQLLCRADDALILGHRLSEWTGHSPSLEEELAFANIALDLIGQARALYDYAGTLSGHSEDQLAYLRDAPAWRNCLIVELPNGDFAFTIARLLLVTAFALTRQLARRTVPRPHSRDQPRSPPRRRRTDRLPPAPRGRMADPAGRRHGRASAPPRAGRRSTRCGPIPASCSPAGDPELTEPRCGPGPRCRYATRLGRSRSVSGTGARRRLARPEDGWMQSGGRSGRHTEHLGHLLAEMQFLQRTYPGAAW